MKHKIGLAGGIACGKTTVAQSIIATFPEMQNTSFGGVMRAWSAAHGLPVTRDALQAFGKNLIEENGYAGLLDWLIANSADIDWDKGVIVDGFRHPGVYQRFKEYFPKAVLVCCVCSKEVQIQRLKAREGLKEKQAQAILAHPVEQETNSLRQFADVLWTETSTINDLVLWLQARTL
jgi:dephospho-CoA kinase